MSNPAKTHEDLMPRDVCPSLLMKHIVTHSMADEVHDDREEPGDGYYWCAQTCTPVGPDDELCAPKLCRSHRPCYQGPTS